MDFIHEPSGAIHFTLSPHIFVLNRILNGHLYMTCALKKCRAAICLRHNVIYHIKGHNHESNEDAIKATRFTKILRVRAIEENGRIVDIYNDLVNQYPEGAQCITSVHAVKQHMGRARGYRPSAGYASFHNEPSGKIHCTFDSYVYRITKKYTSFCFARCVKTPKCPGRAVIYQGWFRVSNPHNHPSSRRRVKRMLFLKGLKHRSASKNEPLSHSFHEERRLHPQGSADVTFLSAKFQMSRARMIGEAAQPHVWYMPVDHSIYQKGSLNKPRTIIVGRPRAPKTILQTGPSVTNSLGMFQNAPSNIIPDKCPVKIDWEKLPHPVLTRSKRDKQALRAQFKKNLRKTCSELMEKVTCNTASSIHQYSTNRKQSQILPDASNLYKNIDPYTSNRNQSQILPPAQNLYFIMPPYYPPPAQQQELVQPIVSNMTGDVANVEVEVKKSDLSEMDAPDNVHVPEVKIEIKEEMLDCGVFDDEVIDLSRESEFEDVKDGIILMRGEDERCPKENISPSMLYNDKASVPVNNILGQGNEVPKLIQDVATIKNNTSIDESTKNNLTLQVNDSIIVDADDIEKSTTFPDTNVPPIKMQDVFAGTSSRLSPIPILDTTDANASTQTDPPTPSGEARDEMYRAHTDIVTETLMEMHKILKNLRSERNSSNEVFGKYVATSMGCMSKKNAQAARREILEVLDKYEA